VTNSGRTTITNGTATVSAPFSILSGATFSVPGFGSANVVVQFAPTFAGGFANNVIFTTANGGNSTNQLTGKGTQSPPDTTPPTLTILSPTDYQAFTNSATTVTGTASDASGIKGVTVGGAAASGSTNWLAAFTLHSVGTNTIIVIATDNSAYMNTATQIVHAVLLEPSTNPPPVIVTAPVVTNALLQLTNVAVVAQGDTNVFMVGAVDPGGYPLSYQWTFGDGTNSDWLTTNIASHVYTTNCGPYTAGVIVSDGHAIARSNLTVIIACQLTVTKMQVKLNFAKQNADSASLTAILDLDAGFNLTNKVVRLDIGGTTNVTFALDAKGKGRGVSSFGSCKLAYNKKMKQWTLRAKLAKGSWQASWATYGLENKNVPKPGVWVAMPVVVLIGSEAFADERPMLYTAILNKSGSAK
jgi:hypothetical protein